MRHLKVEKLDIIPSQHYLNTLFDCLSKHLQSDTYDFNTATDRRFLGIVNDSHFERVHPTIDFQIGSQCDKTLFSIDNYPYIFL